MSAVAVAQHKPQSLLNLTDDEIAMKETGNGKRSCDVVVQHVAVMTSQNLKSTFSLCKGGFKVDIA